MTQKSYPVETRETYGAEWRSTGENATPAAVRWYNQHHGWPKARLVVPGTPPEEDEEPEPLPSPEEKLRATMADVGRLTTHHEEEE